AAGTHLGAGQGDRLGGGGVRGHAHVQQLIGAQPQYVPQRGVHLLQRTVHAGGEDRVEATLRTQRAVEQLGGERRVAPGDAVAAQQPGQAEVRVGVLLAHQAQALERDLSGRGGAAGALGRAGGRVAAARTAVAAGAGAGAALLVTGAAVAAVVPSAAVRGVASAVPAASSLVAHARAPSCWSLLNEAFSARFAPRAQSAARMGRFPAGASVEIAMASVPVPTSTWRRPAAIRPGGSGVGSGASSTPRILVRAPSSSVQAPGCGLMPRMWALTCSAGRDQSIRASAVVSLAACVARSWS